MDSVSVPTFRTKLDLFLVSLLILFLELACIRWFPAHVLFLTFFTNTVLLACFLGISVGCLTASSRWNFLRVSPLLLAIAVGSAIVLEGLAALGVGSFVDVGDQTSPQIIYFGAENYVGDLANFRIPVELINGFVFLLAALSFVGPGQLLGRLLRRIPDRIQAYSIDICGSMVGILLFTGVSWLQLSPFWWFLPPSMVLAYLLAPKPAHGWALVKWSLNLLLLITIPFMAEGVNQSTYWSPYYRINYVGDPSYFIIVNLLGHQQMIPRGSENRSVHPYALPHLLNRDTGSPPFADVLVIGAGSGNDVSRALYWGAKHVDAVEIDPVIQRLGKQFHPDRPYDDSRVTVHLDDGRNFLRSTDKQYDLIVFALVDSLVLHSSLSNIRLESYLFTRQSLQDVKHHLKPGGIFVMCNYFRQGWVVSRLSSTLNDVFGREPLAIQLPYTEEIPEQNLHGAFTLLMAGDTSRIQEAFSRRPEYWLRNAAVQAELADPPNGFTVAPPAKEKDAWTRLGLARVTEASEARYPPTDDWPFLYLHWPMIPDLTLRGMAIMGSIAVVLLLGSFACAERGAGGPVLGARMFFLGAGFMLIETTAVVHMALLFGSTWIVNSVVFFAVLAMILCANLLVQTARPKNLAPYYAGLLLTLAMNALVPLDWFLGMNRFAQISLACSMGFAPILFAGVIFAVSFARVGSPDRAFGFNIAGAMTGGLAENTSMLFGFQYLFAVAALFYLLSILSGGRGGEPELQRQQVAG